MYVTTFTTRLDFGSNTWKILTWLPPGCCRHGASCVHYFMCVQILSLFAAKWPVLPTCIHLILVSWYIVSTLCCRCWMFSLSDALPMHSYPTKVWFLCAAAVQNSVWHNDYLFPTDLFFYMKSVVYYGRHYFRRMFILINCKECYFCFELIGFCMAESWARRLFHSA